MSELDTKAVSEVPESPEDTESKTVADKIEEDFRERIKTIKEQIAVLKKECVLLEKLEREVKKELRVKVSKKKRSNPNPNSAFKLPQRISPDLCKFLGLEKGSTIPRTEVTKLLCKWINEKNIKNTEDKRVIDIMSAKAAPLRGIMTEISKEDSEKFTCFTMQKYIQHHYNGTFREEEEKKEEEPKKEEPKAKKTSSKKSTKASSEKEDVKKTPKSKTKKSKGKATKKTSETPEAVSV